VGSCEGGEFVFGVDRERPAVGAAGLAA
jgi:hypothetical protein